MLNRKLSTKFFKWENQNPRSYFYFQIRITHRNTFRFVKMAQITFNTESKSDFSDMIHTAITRFDFSSFDQV